jgi:hypothetical protein
MSDVDDAEDTFGDTMCLDDKHSWFPVEPWDVTPEGKIIWAYDCISCGAYTHDCTTRRRWRMPPAATFAKVDKTLISTIGETT